MSPVRRYLTHDPPATLPCRPGLDRHGRGADALGGVTAFGVQWPAEVERYVDVLDLGLILIWSGVLLLVMQVVLHRPGGPRRADRRAAAYADRSDEWYEQDVHRPGYAGQTRRLPTVRDR
ncbi:MAG TPA: hypothetical protein VF423_07480 [Actinomycetes bacterium]